MNRDLHITDRIVIPAADLDVTSTRSGGAGGQHVNTAETAVILRFAMADCAVLHPAVKARVREARPSVITTEGDVVIRADNRRSRLDNHEAARHRLRELIRQNLKPPKRRKRTRPSRRAKQRRRAKKRHRGKIKSLRGRVRRDDW